MRKSSRRPWRSIPHSGNRKRTAWSGSSPGPSPRRCTPPPHGPTAGSCGRPTPWARRPRSCRSPPCCRRLKSLRTSWSAWFPPPPRTRRRVRRPCSAPDRAPWSARPSALRPGQKGFPPRPLSVRYGRTSRHPASRRRSSHPRRSRRRDGRNPPPGRCTGSRKSASFQTRPRSSPKGRSGRSARPHRSPCPAWPGRDSSPSPRQRLSRRSSPCRRPIPVRCRPWDSWGKRPAHRTPGPSGRRCACCRSRRAAPARPAP